MASSLFVVFPIAETTTIGFRAARARTIADTRSMAVADSTEVPPNFITIMAWSLADAAAQAFQFVCFQSKSRKSNPGRWAVGPAIQHPLRVHHLGVEHGRTRGTADGVVCERDEFIVEYRARTQPTDKRCHAAVALGVVARLRPVLLRHVGYRL